MVFAPDKLETIKNWLEKIAATTYHANNTVVQHVMELCESPKAHLLPRTDVYVTDQGESYLLIKLAGQMNLNYAGSHQEIPIVIWLPESYPYCAPIMYIDLTSNTRLQTGRLVDANGQCHNGYLDDWQEHSSGKTLLGLVSSFQSEFMNNMPIVVDPAINKFDLPARPEKQINAVAGPKHSEASVLDSKEEAQTSSEPPKIPNRPLPSKFPLPTKSTFTITSALPSTTSFRRLTKGKNIEKKEDAREIPKPQNNMAKRLFSTSKKPVNPENDNYMDSVTINDPTNLNETEDRRKNIIHHILERMSKTHKDFWASDEIQNIKPNRSIDEKISSIEAVVKLEKLNWHQFTQMTQQADHKLRECENNVSRVETVFNKFTNYDPIQSIDAPNTLAKQAIEAYTEDEAITDTINLLSKSLDHEIITLDAFLKLTKQLAREQFMQKAIFLKCRQQLEAQQI